MKLARRISSAVLEAVLEQGFPISGLLVLALPSTRRPSTAGWTSLVAAPVQDLGAAAAGAPTRQARAAEPNRRRPDFLEAVSWQNQCSG
jgi:hypothetical protein